MGENRSGCAWDRVTLVEGDNSGGRMGTPKGGKDGCLGYSPSSGKFFESLAGYLDTCPLGRSQSESAGEQPVSTPVNTPLRRGLSQDAGARFYKA